MSVFGALVLLSSDGFSSKFFFHCMINPFPSSGVFALLRKVNNPKKVKILVWQVFHGRVNILD